MFKVIQDFPRYRIHDSGLIESDYPDGTWKELKQVYDKSSGYMLVTLCYNGIRKNKRVHRLLMEAFVPNPLGLTQINHKDANKLNNSLDNLEWCSPKENSIHAVSLGLNSSCIETNRTGVNQFDMESNFINSFKSLHEAERLTGICWQNIWKVCNNLRRSAGSFRWEYSKC